MMAIFYQNADTPENMLKANLSLEDEFPKEVQDEAIATVKALIDAHVEVGVITSINSRLARKDLQRLGFPIEQFFIIQGADESTAHKPDPRVFDKALQMLAKKKISAAETLYVGDALMDYYAARDAGLEFFGATTGFVTQQQFEEKGARSAFSLVKLLED